MKDRDQQLIWEAYGDMDHFDPDGEMGIAKEPLMRHDLDEKWYTTEEWMQVLEDMVSGLSPGFRNRRGQTGKSVLDTEMNIVPDHTSPTGFKNGEEPGYYFNARGNVIPSINQGTKVKFEKEYQSHTEDFIYTMTIIGSRDYAPFEITSSEINKYFTFDPKDLASQDLDHI